LSLPFKVEKFQVGKGGLPPLLRYAQAVGKGGLPPLLRYAQAVSVSLLILSINYCDDG
jgi:hypothetical protein